MAERGKSKADIAREQLVPLEEGERPAGGDDRRDRGRGAGGRRTSSRSRSAVAASRRACRSWSCWRLRASGMWRGRYWAVLGFQVLLALTLINGFLFLLIRASKPLEIAAALLVTGGAGALFWFLVRALARLQMPERRPRAPDQ